MASPAGAGDDWGKPGPGERKVSWASMSQAAKVEDPPAAPQASPAKTESEGLTAKVAAVKLEPPVEPATAAATKAEPAVAATKAEPAPKAFVKVSHKELIELKGEGLAFEVEFKDQLQSASQWDDLKVAAKQWEQIKKNLVTKMNFQAPAKIQAAALPHLLETNPPENMIFQSQAGTGKTAAFAITALCRIDVQDVTPQAIILAPNQHVVDQHVRTFATMAENTGIIIQGHYSWNPGKGKDQPTLDARQAAIKANVDLAGKGNPIRAHIIIGTAGKILRYFPQGRKRGVLDAGKIKVLVVDEADELFSSGSNKTSDSKSDTLDLKRKLDKTRQPPQVVLCSATYTRVQSRTFKDIVGDPVNTISLPLNQVTVANLRQYWVHLPEQHDRDKDQRQRCEVVKQVFEDVSIQTGIIFCERVENVDAVCNMLKNELDTDCRAIHGRMSKVDQQNVLIDFRAGKFKYLCTTSILARGVDIPKCTMVINFNLPVICDDGRRPEDPHNKANCETYLHRIGRAGRFGAPGFAVSLAATEAEVRRICEIQDHWQHPIAQLQVGNIADIEDAIAADE